MKNIQDFVWPVENYTTKIHSGIKIMFQLRPWLSYTISQMKESLVNGYPWLANPNERQTALLNKILKTGIQKLVQAGLVKKVHSNTTVESQWQSTGGVEGSGYDNVTSVDSVAATADAKKAIKHRAIGGRSLWRLNHKTA